MSTPLTLRCGALRCDLRPDLGGSIAGMWMHELAVMRSTPGAALANVRDSASFPLVPFSNRVGNGQLQWLGETHTLPKNFATEPHAIHGVGWERPWAVVRGSDTEALLSLTHQANASWPFDFACTQAFTLEEGALAMHMRVTNHSPKVAPMGLGWHPYFMKREDTRVQFRASGRWEMGADKLPTHCEPHTGLDQSTTGLKVDHCFDGWDGVLTLTDQQLHVTVRSGLSRLVVFTTLERDHIAVEPVSHVNNAMNMVASTESSAQRLGVVALQPGESMECSMRVEVRAAHEVHA
ncbi:MAG: aldose 1-epimerase [Rhodoferax sp.]|nr:aldose 1-epimerase [Rhodoferax sp.]